jgi:cell division protein FtsQ
VVERYLAWRALLDDLGDAPLHIQVDARQSWRVLLASGAVLELGRVDVDQRMRRFVDTANLILRATDQRIMTADLRYPNGLAIRWRGNDGN